MNWIEIANGKKKWSPVIKEFYTPFAKTLEKVGEAARVKIEVEKTDEICPQDGGHLIIRIGRFGKFMACENFPDCKFTKAFGSRNQFNLSERWRKNCIQKDEKRPPFLWLCELPKM